ncbi:unnamed protein product, partial [Medioppia subpectinata]
DKLRDRHSNLHVLQLDGTDYKSFDGFAKQVADIVGDRGLDTLINNAGIAIASKLDAVTADDMVTSFKVNSVAPLMLTKALLPVLKKSGATKRKTTVANISSLGGCITNIHMAKDTLGMVYPYFTSKAALDMITKCLSVDLAAYGINAVAVHPGHVKTDMGGPTGALTVETSADVLITGANRGIGLGLVTALLTKPNGGPKHVIATTRQTTNPALDELRDRHSNLHVLQLDGTDYKSFDGFAKQV